MSKTSKTKKTTQQLQEKYQRLNDLVSGYKEAIVAYSGGVDSVFLLQVTVERLGAANVLAVIGQSESLAQSEYEGALRIAEQIGAQVIVVQPREMDNTDYAANTANRCFYCKTELYCMLTQLAQERGYEVVLCGANADDQHDWRPGLQAAKEYKVESPLAEAGLTKDDIRQLSKQLGLSTWDKPAQPCLASRVAYGLEITPEKLRQIERGEEYLHSLGLRELRVRHHGNLVRIEVPQEDIGKLICEPQRSGIVGFFKNLGFAYVSLDLQGFRSGSGNEIL